MTVAVSWRSRKAEHDYVRAETANIPDDVAEHLFARPLGERLRGGFRESEVDGAGEELFRTIDPTGGKKFLSANDSELVALFAADEILSALAAGERQVGGPQVQTAGKIGQKSRIFVIGMGRDHHHATQRIETFEGLADFDFPGNVPLGTEGAQQKGTKQDHAISSFHS
jgi:hypothetical protein